MSPRTTMILKRQMTLAYSRKSISAALRLHLGASVAELEVCDGRLGSVADPKAPVDLRQVELDRMHAELEPSSRFGVCHPRRDHPQHFELTRCQRPQTGPIPAVNRFLEHGTMLGRGSFSAHARWVSVRPRRASRTASPARNGAQARAQTGLPSGASARGRP